MMFNILRNDIKFYDIFYVAQYLNSFPAGTTKDMTLETRDDPRAHDL